MAWHLPLRRLFFSSPGSCICSYHSLKKLYISWCNRPFSYRHWQMGRSRSWTSKNQCLRFTELRNSSKMRLWVTGWEEAAQGTPRLERIKAWWEVWAICLSLWKEKAYGSCFIPCGGWVNDLLCVCPIISMYTDWGPTCPDFFAKSSFM